MALTAEQQAMLQLVLERGQSYGDIAGVLGVGVDEVRTRARAALTELGGSDPDADVGLTDYLLGQADPIGRADAVRHLQGDPDARRIASELVERLREIAPDAELPELPAPRERRAVLGRRRAPASPAPREREDVPAAAGRGRFRDTLSRRQQQVIVGLGAAAVLVLMGVLALAGAFGGGGEDSEPATETQATTAAEEDVLASVRLQPQGGGDGGGEASFGLATGDQPYVDLELSGLSAPDENQSYVVWLLLTEEQGYPLSPLEVGSDGTFSDRFPIPQFAIPIASRARFVDISLSENRSLLGNLERAVRDQKPILGYQGESVLRGEIPASAQGQAQGGGRGPEGSEGG
ncbi:MAG: hypothetical protein ACRDMA_00160 [Solirubrobacterales bacterium]